MPATIARIQFAQREFEFDEKSDAGILTSRILAREITIDSFFGSAADADTHNQAIFDLLKANRDLYRVTVHGIHLVDFDGDTPTVNLTFPRGEAAGKDFAVVGVTYDTGRETTEFLLWG